MADNPPMTRGVPSGEALEFRLFGPLEALKDRQPLRLGGSAQRAFLALLLLPANEVVSSDRVIDEPRRRSPRAVVASSG
ncbi:MAG: hypothetical protein C5B48_05115 [Candidatus Rokuibacteriota bacterium]|nr:MAG: hypothetical protein C5B48_05115 [Candidatus Rokubacteria bacterium]